MARLFFALWPDAAVREQLDAVARTVEIRGGRRITPANLHVTLLFLGQVAQDAVPTVFAVGDRVDGESFSLEMTQYGWWRRPQVAWLAPQSIPAALMALECDIRGRALALGLEPDQRPYRPHVSIAKKITQEPHTSADLHLRWRVTSFALIRSTTASAGAQYEVLREWPLRAAGSE